MIYPIANEHGVKIPSSFGYMIWSGAVRRGCGSSNEGG